MSIERNYLSTLFAGFESEKFKEISELEIKNFNAWQIVKFPLYFNLIELSKGDQKDAPGISRNKALFLLKKTVGCLHLLLSLMKLFVKAGGKKKVLFYTYSADKPAKDEKGYYFNFLTDAFITNKIIPEFIYIENSLKGIFKRPSYIQYDFRGDDLSNIISLYIRFYNRDIDLDKQAEKMFSLLRDYFIERNTEIPFTRNTIKNILLLFFAEYRAAKVLLKVCKPALIISSEQPGKGLLAAARDLKIDSIDLQHGVIDRFHPQYTYSGKLKDIKNRMILPSFIGVFGQLHKEILLSGGFWKEEEIVVLGSSRVHMNREKYLVKNADPDSGEKWIVIPTQWTVFKELSQLLTALLEQPDTEFKIILKVHPLEPQNNIEYFNSLYNKYPGKIRVADKNEDIYSLVIASFLVIGFDSAVLLESVSLSKPCITITTNDLPEGIHSFYRDDKLKSAIKSIGITENSELKKIIDRALHDKGFYEEWVSEANAKADYLYATRYIDNCKEFIQQTFSKN